MTYLAGSPFTSFVSWFTVVMRAERRLGGLFGAFAYSIDSQFLARLVPVRVGKVIVASVTKSTA